MTDPPRNALEELADYPQWLCWQSLPPLEEGKKPRKVPVNPHTGRPASTIDPTTWGTIEDALAYRENHDEIAGCGFVFTRHDPFVGIDLDGCRDDETGTIAEWAMEIVRQLDSYAELSPSGTGLHVLVRATLPPFGRRKGRVEIYESERYFTVTGLHIDGTPTVIAARQFAVDSLHAELFGALDDNAPRIMRTKGPVQTPDDGRLLDRMFGCAKGDRIRALWNGDTSMHGGDDSAADLALCDYLAFWTAADAARVDRLFRQSGLMREKWNEKRGALTYGERTITRAVSGKAFDGGGIAA